MALPPNAKPFAVELDPSDEEVFYIFFMQGEPDATPAPILLPGEGVATYDLAVTPEAATVGLDIIGADRAPTLSGNELTLWLRVVDELQGSSLFDGQGVLVGIEVTPRTTTRRRKQKTVLVRIVNQ